MNCLEAGPQSGQISGFCFTHAQFNNPHVQNQCSKVSEDWYTLTDLCDA